MRVEVQSVGLVVIAAVGCLPIVVQFDCDTTKRQSVRGGFAFG